MAHFAKISEENIVLNVLRLDNKDASTEEAGQQYLETHSNWPANLWIQTSYNTWKNKHELGGTPLRGNYAAVGFEWDPENQIFWPPKDFPSWVKDIPNAKWTSPIGDAPALTAEQQSQNDAQTHLWAYSWNESGQSWDLNNLL
jgi:hypothetical protein